MIEFYRCQKFKVGFVKIRFLDKNWTFDIVWGEAFLQCVPLGENSWIEDDLSSKKWDKKTLLLSFSENKTRILKKRKVGQEFYCFNSPILSAWFSSSCSFLRRCITRARASLFLWMISPIFLWASLWGLGSTIHRKYIPCQRFCKIQLARATQLQTLIAPIYFKNTVDYQLTHRLQYFVTPIYILINAQS